MVTRRRKSLRRYGLMAGSGLIALALILCQMLIAMQTRAVAAVSFDSITGTLLMNNVDDAEIPSPCTSGDADWEHWPITDAIVDAVGGSDTENFAKIKKIEANGNIAYCGLMPAIFTTIMSSAAGGVVADLNITSSSVLPFTLEGTSENDRNIALSTLTALADAEDYLGQEINVNLTLTKPQKVNLWVIDNDVSAVFNSISLMGGGQIFFNDQYTARTLNLRNNSEVVMPAGTTQAEAIAYMQNIDVSIDCTENVLTDEAGTYRVALMDYFEPIEACAETPTGPGVPDTGAQS